LQGDEGPSSVPLDSAGELGYHAVVPLPIYAAEDEIVAALRANRVIVVEGPTGSGKTTQLPRILRKHGFNNRRIGVTQPRRIAAVSVARRIAEEEQVEFGREVGYAIRFEDVTSRETEIKVMTDGILLQEARSDPDLSQYGVLMIDEAHERSLNIDICMGLIYGILERRSDLRVIVSSATLKAETFQHFFEPVAGEVPFISVKARIHPVDIRYTEHPPDFDALIERTAAEVARIHREEEPGHILAFFSGQAGIEKTALAVPRYRPGDGLVVLPLFARLTREEQERVFHDFDGPNGARARKAVFATNIAETSLTIPDVRYVIDSGLAKVPRFNTRTGITTLREEPISRASAEQRAGRAGRTGPGIVLRLYTRADQQWQPDYTDEEIRRLDLVEVALRLIDLGITEVEDFPYLTKPKRGQLKAAIEKLRVLGAIDRSRQLTDVGRKMVPFPLSPSLARMVVESMERYRDVVDDVLVVAAFLSMRNPFLFPMGEEAEANRAHAALAHPWGDATTALTTYRRWGDAGNRKRFCEENYLDADLMRFAERAHGQLVEIAEGMGASAATGGDLAHVVRCLATGFADRVLLGKGRNFESLVGDRVSIHPSSTLFRGRHKLIVAAELVESSRVFARSCSVVRPDWLSEINPDAAKRWKVGTRGKQKG